MNVRNVLIFRLIYVGLLWVLPAVTFSFEPAAFLQVREVKGIVVNAQNKPVSDVNILVKGSDLVVHTNEKGEFRTKLPSEFEVLVFEQEGYKTQEVRITGFDNMLVVLVAEVGGDSRMKSEKIVSNSRIQSIESKGKVKTIQEYTSTPIRIEKMPAPDVDIQPVQSPKSTYDVCVFGATSAGIIAAYTAAKSGKSVLIVAAGDHLGGLSSGGLGQTDIGNKHVVKGLSRDFYRQLGKVYGALEAWQFEPKEASKIFKKYIKEGHIDYIIHGAVNQVVKDGQKIKNLEVRSQKNGAVYTIVSKVYIDASYEGDLLAKAGVSFTIGREGNQMYGETYNGVYLPKYRAEASGYHQFPDQISPYKIPNDPRSGLLFGVQGNTLAERGAGDKFTQAYNFRITLTDSLENQLPIVRPKNYDSTRYELLVRLFEAQPQLREINDYFIWSKMPNRKTDINNRGAFSTDYIGANHSYPLASPEERQKIVEDHLTYTQGLLYFYATDPRVPEQLQEYVKKWGYPKDEFVHNNHFTPQLYVREARRMIGEYVMTEHNCLGKEIVPDGIAYAAYTMDSHNTQRIVVNGMVKNEGNVEIGGFSPYPISYRSLVPKRQEVNNLIVPICMSASHIAYGSIRMEPVFMLLGQVAGLAAVESIQKNQIVQDVDYKAINQKMENDPYLQNGFKDIVIDNRDLPVVNTDSWTKKVHKIYYANDLAVSKDQQSLKVNITNVKAARYKLYYFVPVVSEIYNDPYYSFSFESKKVNVNLMDHLNDWLLLGEVDLTKHNSTSIRIENDSHIVYDAVQLVPVVE